MEGANPEVKEVPLQQILAKVSIGGDHPTSVLVETLEDIVAQVSNPVFQDLLKLVEEEKSSLDDGLDGNRVLIDLGSKISSISEDDAKTLVELIRRFNEKNELMAGAFKNYQEFVRFKPLATAIGLDSKIDFNKIKEAV